MIHVDFKTMNFVSKARNLVLKTRNCVFNMMNYAGRESQREFPEGAKLL